MEESMFEIELELISNRSIQYLFGYYEQALEIGLRNGWRQATPKQMKTIIEALYAKIDGKQLTVSNLEAK